MAADGLVQLDETAVLARQTDGKVRMAQDLDIVGRDQQAGHIVGLLAAAATGTLPVILGATLAGRLLGTLTDHGITSRFLKRVGRQLQPGTSALVILGRSDPANRRQVLERLRQFNPKVLESNLPPALEQRLEQLLAEHTSTEAGPSTPERPAR
jgi:uncharacterized membrane protein